MKTFSHRVVITGIGPVTSIGTGKEAFWNSLLAGNINVSEIPAQFERSYKFKSRFYVPFPEVSLGDFGLNPKLISLMESSSVIGLVAAKLAIEDAGLSWDAIRNNVPVNSKDWGVVIGTGICTLKAGFAAFASNAMNEKKELLKELGISGHYNRLVIPMIMPNAVAAWISIISGIKGPGFTVNASCASGTYAIGEAFKKLKNGEAKMALAGGVECLQDASGTVMRGFDTLGTLTQSKNGKPEPFSNGRTGFLFSEGGACMLVLETLESAVERGIIPYAEIMDYKSNSDSNNIVQIEESGAQIKELILALSKDLRIDYFNSHGTGTLLNDRVEAQIIRDLFGDKENQPLVNSTKSMTGHAIGASGAMEIAATALSIRNSMVHINLADDPMDKLNLVMQSQPCDIQYAITASYGFGGHNAALLLGKINSD
jgi:3-oxoacyl-[acyl-carrier-protein] synthase II